MSAEKYYLLCCDGCGHPTSGGMLDMRTTQREVRRIGREQGWAYRSRAIPPRDLCPTCLRRGLT